MVPLAIVSEGGKYNGKITWFVVLSCMMASMGGFIYGFQLGISGGVTSMEPFRKKFFPEVLYRNTTEVTKTRNYSIFDSRLLTAYKSSLFVAVFVASFFASWVTKAFGRKTSILLGAAAYFAGFISSGAAINVGILIFGRVLLGVGVGFINQSVPLYLSEMAPARYTGAINNGFQFSIGIGIISANLIIYRTENITSDRGWRISLAIGAIPAAILTLGALFLPETPNSLIQRTDGSDRAKAMLQRVRGTEDVQAEFNDLVEANSTSATNENSFKNIIRRKYRPQLVMAIAIPFFREIIGINVIAVFTPILLMTVTVGKSAALTSAVLIGVVGTGSTFISMLVVDKLGRRALFLFGGAQMFVSQIMVGGIIAAQLEDHDSISKGFAYFVLIMICMYVSGFAWSWGPLGWLVPSEIFSLGIRSAGESIVPAVCCLCNIILPCIFLAKLSHSKSWIFFFFGGWVVVMTTFVYYLVPETKNIPIEKTDKVWREHWFWKRFVAEKDGYIQKVAS